MADSETEISKLVTVLSDLWPLMVVTKQLVEHPTSDFVIDIFLNISHDMDVKYCDVLPFGEIPGDNVQPAMDSSTVSLYLKMRWVLQELGVDFFKISDLYLPNPKRTRTYFRILTTFLLYLDTRQVQYENINKEYLEKQAVNDELLEKINVIKTELNSKAMTIAMYNTKLREAKETLEGAKELNKNKSLKAECDGQHNENLRNDLQSIADELDTKKKQLKLVRTNKKTLQEKIVSEGEFESLKWSKKELDNEIAEANNKTIAYTSILEGKKETVELLAKLHTQLIGIQFESLNELQLVKSIREEIANKEISDIQVKQKQIELIKSKICELNEIIKNAEEQVQTEITKADFLKDNLVSECKHLEDMYDAKMMETKKNKKHIQHYEKLKGQYQQKYEGTVAKLDKLQLCQEDEYKKMLEADRSAVLAFNDVLLQLTNKNSQ